MSQNFETHCGFSAHGGGRGLEHQGHDALCPGIRGKSWRKCQSEVRIEQGHSEHRLNANGLDARIQGRRIHRGQSAIHLTNMPCLRACRQVKSTNASSFQVCPVRARVEYGCQRRFEYGVWDWRIWKGEGCNLS